MSLFEKAVRTKLRFESSRGLLTVEDVYDLPLSGTRGPSLDELAKGVNRLLKQEEEESFVVVTEKKSTEVLRLKLDVLKHVIGVKKGEAEAVRAASERREKKERILEILARKKDAELEGKSSDELEKMVAEL